MKKIIIVVFKINQLIEASKFTGFIFVQKKTTNCNFLIVGVLVGIYKTFSQLRYLSGTKKDKHINDFRCFKFKGNNLTWL